MILLKYSFVLERFFILFDISKSEHKEIPEASGIIQSTSLVNEGNN